MSEFLRENKRSNYCGNFRKSDVGSKVTVNGWVDRKREMSSLIFLTLRDREGVIQIAFNEEKNKELYLIAKSLKPEYCIGVTGTIQIRESINKEIPTGEIEIIPEKLEVFSESKVSPIDIKNDIETDENLKLKYRYLDLRRKSNQEIFKLRSEVSMSIREFLTKNGFIDLETPILTKSTPEGARDYLVPSRKNQGQFYALPQSPQIFKQLLMISGFDKYFQIAKCFRDEDLRASRQPEFTQVDMEMSFVTEEEIMNISEKLIQKVFKDTKNYDVSLPIKRMTYKEAMDRYGSDKPDLRYGMEIIDLTDGLKNNEFIMFKEATQSNGSIRSICVKNAASMARKEIDKLTDFVKMFKAKGLAYIALKEDGIKASIQKFLSDDDMKFILEKNGAQTGDLIFIVAGENRVVLNALGNLRCETAKKFEITKDNKEFKFVWITDFPMFEFSEESNRYVSSHHPFTHPNLDDVDMLLEKPEAVRSIAYDLVLNGEELGGGSIRIHDNELQKTVFEALGFTEESAKNQFGFFLDALEYGTPPHGGIAFGLDRLVMSIYGTENIKDVIAFPKNQNAYDPLTQAPSFVDEKQLKEIGIDIVKGQE